MRTGRPPHKFIEPCQQDARQQQIWQRTEAERQHQQGAAPGRTGAERGCQRAVDQSAWQPAPQQAERKRLDNRLGRQEAPRQRLNETPEVLAGALGKGQRPRHPEQIETEGDQHQVGQQIEPEADRRLPVQRQAGGAERPGQRAGGGVGKDAAGIVG